MTIAINDKSYDARKTAVRNLTDQKLLADIAVNDKSIHVRRAALEKLTDHSLAQKLYFDEAVNKENHSVHRYNALSGITDQELLFEIIQRSLTIYDSFDVCEKAINKLTCRDMLTKIINGGEEYFLKWEEFMGHGPFGNEDVWEPQEADLRDIARKRLNELMLLKLENKKNE